MKIALTATPSIVQFAPILWSGQIEEAFALAAELGYDNVELHLRSPGDVAAEDVLALKKEFGLTVPALSTGMAAGKDGLTFTDPVPEVRKRAVARIANHVGLAARLGSAVIIGLIRGKVGRDAQRGARRDSCWQAWRSAVTWQPKQA